MLIWYGSERLNALRTSMEMWKNEVKVSSATSGIDPKNFIIAIRKLSAYKKWKVRNRLIECLIFFLAQMKP